MPIWRNIRRDWRREQAKTAQFYVSDGRERGLLSLLAAGKLVLAAAAPPIPPKRKREEFPP